MGILSLEDPLNAIYIESRY